MIDREVTVCSRGDCADASFGLSATPRESLAAQARMLLDLSTSPRRPSDGSLEFSLVANFIKYYMALNYGFKLLQRYFKCWFISTGFAIQGLGRLYQAVPVVWPIPSNSYNLRFSR